MPDLIGIYHYRNNKNTIEESPIKISIHQLTFIRVTLAFIVIIGHLKAILLGMVVMAFGAAFGFAHFEKLPIADALYFTMITGLTVGYGDITPQTAVGRIIAIMVALMGVIFSGLIVAAALRAVGQSLTKPKPN